MKAINDKLVSMDTDITLKRWEIERLNKENAELKKEIAELKNDIEKYKENEVNRI